MLKVPKSFLFFLSFLSLSFFLLFYIGGGDEVLETGPCNLGYRDQARLRLSYMILSRGDPNFCIHDAHCGQEVYGRIPGR